MFRCYTNKNQIKTTKFTTSFRSHSTASFLPSKSNNLPQLFCTPCTIFSTNFLHHHKTPQNIRLRCFITIFMQKKQGAVKKTHFLQLLEAKFKTTFVLALPILLFDRYNVAPTVITRNAVLCTLFYGNLGKATAGNRTTIDFIAVYSVGYFKRIINVAFT